MFSKAETPQMTEDSHNEPIMELGSIIQFIVRPKYSYLENTLAIF